jgi:hypothetical protein
VNNRQFVADSCEKFPLIHLRCKGKYKRGNERMGFKESYKNYSNGKTNNN